MDACTAYEHGQRLALRLVPGAARWRRTPAEVRRAVWRRLVAMLAERPSVRQLTLPGLEPLVPAPLVKSMLAGALAGLHEGIWRLSGHNVRVSEVVAKEIGYATGYASVLWGDWPDGIAPGMAASDALRVVAAFVETQTADHPLLGLIARSGRWDAFFAGAGSGISSAVAALSPRRHAHLRLARVEVA